MTQQATDLVIGGQSIRPGERRTVELRVARLYDFTEQSMTVRVLRGKRSGPTLLLTAAIHGDEMCGVEIVRRVLKSKLTRGLRGTLIAVPIVNMFGFNNLTRYLPDRRDLNRTFPGSEKGSLAARMAHLLVNEVLSKSTHAIDLHTGGGHRKNLPQIRAHLADAEVKRLAEAFHVPVILNSDLRDGSLRSCAVSMNIPMLLFEGGEALRFDDSVVRSGVRGVFNVMRALKMIESAKTASGKPEHRAYEVFTARSSHWLRAPQSGILRATTKLGQRVREGQRLATVSDPLGSFEEPLRARHDGIVIGSALLPVVSRGDAVFHIATFENLDSAMESVVEFDDTYFVAPNGT